MGSRMAGRFHLGTDRKCLITGGTRGIGRAIVDEFVALGAQVGFRCTWYLLMLSTVVCAAFPHHPKQIFVCARSTDDVKATVAELTENGVQAYVSSGFTINLGP